MPHPQCQRRDRTKSRQICDKCICRYATLPTGTSGRKHFPACTAAIFAKRVGGGNRWVWRGRQFMRRGASGGGKGGGPPILVCERRGGGIWWGPPAHLSVIEQRPPAH